MLKYGFCERTLVGGSGRDTGSACDCLIGLSHGVVSRLDKVGHTN